MIIFREIEELVQEIKSRIALLGSEQDTTLDEQRLDLVMKVVLHVNSMSWVSHRTLRAKVRVFLRSRYSYKQVAAEFGVSVKQAHKTLSYAGQCLQKRIGAILVLIREGQLEAAERELAVVTGEVNPTDLFVRGITDRFTPSRSTAIVLSDCRQELRLLAAFSQRQFERIVATLSEDKIRHLLYVLLSTDSAYVRERATLWDYIVRGELRIDECMQALNDDYIYSCLTDGLGSDL